MEDSLSFNSDLYMNRVADLFDSMQENISSMSQAFKVLGIEMARRQRILEKQEEEKRNSRRVKNIERKTSKCPDASCIESTTDNSFSLVRPILNTNEITNIATTTGSISFITPIISSSVSDSDVTLDNINTNVNYNDDLEFFTYEEEVSDSNSYDDLLLSNEDLAFVDSIRNPTFSGIFLSSPTDYSSLSFPTISGPDESAAVSKDLTIISQESSSCTAYLIAIASYLLVDYDFKIKLISYITYQYIIFIWDPGISFTMYFFIHILRFPILP